MNRRILVAGETQKASLAIALRFQHGFGSAPWSNKQRGIVFKSHAVRLPQIQVVGLQTVERFLKHPRGEFAVAAVGADFGHQEDAVAPSLEALAQPVFTLSEMVFPTVVEEG